MINVICYIAELTEQNSGKASVLGETTRVVKDMIDEIKSLKKENAALQSETQYVSLLSFNKLIRLGNGS